MKKNSYLICGVLLAATNGLAVGQTVINSYARVTAISGSTLTIKYAKTSTASLATLTSNTFVAGSQVVLMQVQDNALGSAANDATFGNAVAGAPASAGLYEVLTLSSNVVMSGNDSTLTFAGSLNNTYHLGAHTRVQLVTLAILGSPNYTLNTPLAALPWNGNCGGVVALKVNGTLTLGTSITASGSGFRGGMVSTNNASDQNCQSNYFSNDSTVAPTNRHGYKGEGIYNRQALYPVGRGKLLNGGGGGNVNNSGGGGGGNYTSGGLGGPGYYGSTTACSGAGNSSDGIGGQALNSINISRFYLGGGGGGGQQGGGSFNGGPPATGTPGATGGGIVLLAANVLATASGVPAAITAAGATAADSGNDGAGGGGAGGSILLQVPSYSLAGDLAINVSGGGGGNVGNQFVHGGGGGGGVGVVLTTSTLPTTNVILGNNPGPGGYNRTDRTLAPAAPGADPVGNAVLNSNGATPLPVVLTAFGARRSGPGQALLTWRTAQELNSALFVIERRVDAGEWVAIGQVNAAGNRAYATDYDFTDPKAPAGLTYYRLRQVDTDGQLSFSPVSVLKALNGGPLLAALPNPFDGQLEIVVYSFHPEARYQAELLDIQGRRLRRLTLTDARTVLSTAELPAGMYFVRCSSSLDGPLGETLKLVKR